MNKLVDKLRFWRDNEPVELSEAEFRKLLDRQVQESFNMSLVEFRKQVADGRLDPEAPKVARLAMLVGARAS